MSFSASEKAHLNKMNRAAQDVLLGDLLDGLDGMAASVAFVIGAQGGDIINVALQFKDGSGNDMVVSAGVFAYLSDNANGSTIAVTAPSAGIAIGTEGLAIPVVTNKAFQLVSESDGDLDLNIEEAGADTWYLVIVLPSGLLTISGAITFT